MQATANNRQHLDHRLPIAARVQALTAQLTLREKIAQLLHSAPPVPRLQIPAYNWWNECLHGVARAGRATVFPQAIGMAAAFDAPLLGRVAAAISDEARAKHHDALRRGYRGQYFGLTFWTPNINIFRDPRWGRGQETYGEDPHLTARLGVAFVRGLQGKHPRYLKTVATAKHFAVHSGPEALRHSFNAVVSPRDLRETYLPAFRALVKEAGVASVMGAYNRVNGEPCCGSRVLLEDILRREWGFQGYVVSDCWALQDFHQGHRVTAGPAESAALALRQGCDINCGVLYAELVRAVQAGLVTEAEVDRACQRLFTARMKLGMFDPPARVPFARLRPAVVNCARHRRLALQMARESIVLLENRRGLLPLRRDLKQLAIIGPNALNPAALLGNYYGVAPRMTSVLEGLLGQLPAGVQAGYAQGCEPDGSGPLFFGECGREFMKSTEVIIAVVGYTAELEGEENGTRGGAEGDRARYGLPGRQLELLQALRANGKPLVAVVLAGSPVDLSWLRANADAVLFAWYPGEAGGQAIADVIFGDYNPAGRLPITFPKSYAQLPPFTDYRLRGRTYRFMTKPPQYRFGYGLSYTSFRYRRLRLSRGVIRAGDPLSVSVELRNTGARDGDEVVQLYLSAREASVPVPRLHLEGFRRLHLRAGQETTVRFRLRPEQFAAYDDRGRPFIEPGAFRVAVGGGQPADPAANALSAVVRVKL